MIFRVLRIVVILLIAAGGILGIYSMHHRETLHEPTWDERGIAVEHRRGDIPLSVFVDRSFGGDHVASAERAISSINRDAGCTLMSPIYLLDNADIHIRHEACDEGSEFQPNHPGCTWSNPSRERTIIQVGQPGNTTTSYLIFYHELTHAIGLAHDGVYVVPGRGDESLMFVPITANNAHEHSYRLGIGKHLPSMSDKDRSVLKQRYCE